MKQNQNPDAGPPWDPAAVDGEPPSEAGHTPPNEVADEVVDAAPPRLDVVIIGALQKVENDVDAYLNEVKAVAFDVSTTAGDKLARKHRLQLVTLRTAADTAYETGNAPILAVQRSAREFRDRIKGKVQAVENVIDAQIQAAEAEAERRRVARQEAERVRVADLRERIAQISAVARRAIGKPSAEIEAKIALLVAVPIGDDFAEFQPEAERVHAESLAHLREMLEAAKSQEAEAARLAIERAELDRQRAAHEAAALAETQRQEAAAAAALRREDDARAEIERQQSAARALQEMADAAAAAARAEADRKAAAERAEADRLAAEARAAEQSRIDAERARLDAERAEQDRIAREAREAEEARALEARQATERQEAEARAAEEARQAQERAAQAAREAVEAAGRAQLQANAQALFEACVVGRDALRAAAAAIRILTSVNGVKSKDEDLALAAANVLSATIDAATVVDADLPEPAAAAPAVKPARRPRAKAATAAPAP